MKKSHRVILIALLALLVVVSGICLHFYSEIKSLNGLNEDEYMAEAKAVEVEKEMTYPEIGMDDLVQHSTLVISGIIVEQSEMFGILPVTGGDARGYFDWAVQIGETFRGETTESTITVRAASDFDISMQPGEEVLLFLYQPGMGAGYNTEGDYYYIYGDNQGVYFLHESDGNHTVYNAAMNMTLEQDAFLSEIRALSEQYPVDENWNYKTFLENQELNLKSGFIDEEEYNRLLDETKDYATIVPIS